MTDLTNYAENLGLDWLLGAGAATRPTAWYVGLHTGDPGETGAANEISAGGYVRKAITFAAASGGSKASNSQVAWVAAGAPFGTLTHFSIWDAPSGGNCLLKSALDASVLVADGAPFAFDSGEITVTPSGALTTYAMNLLLDWLLGATAVTRPTAWYVGLHSADPGANATANEISGNGYARKAATFAAASGGSKVTSADLVWIASGGAWGAITHLSVFDALTSGNGLFKGAASGSVTVADHAPYALAAGQFACSFD